MHRADLHDALASVVPSEIINLNKKLVGLDQAGGRVTLRFEDGSTASADAVVGADGVHSVVRDIVVGPDAPIHKGRIAYRAVFPSRLMDGFDIGPSRTKWWGADRHIVIYYTNKAKSEVYFVTSVPEPAEWLTRESWSAKGDVRELRAAYEGFHQDVRNVLNACPDCHKWAILEREPLRRWSDGRVVLLGDSAHPMTPYMNIFLARDVLGGGDVVPEKGYQGHFASFDLSKLKGVLHINIEKMDIIHTQLLTKILQIPETPARLEGEGLPIRYVVPPDAAVDLWDSGMPAVVQAGDTLETLAIKYRVPLWALTQINEIPEGAALVANQRVIVPRHLVPLAAITEQSPSKR